MTLNPVLFHTFYYFLLIEIRGLINPENSLNTHVRKINKTDGAHAKEPNYSMNSVQAKYD